MSRTLFLSFALLTLVGCSSSNPGKVGEAVPVSGQAAFSDGRPVKDLMLVLQPTGHGRMAYLPLSPDGTFKGEVIPDTYVFYFEPLQTKVPAEYRKTAEALNAMPEEYRTGHNKNSVDVKSGANLQIKVS
jgi:hypothetical protein